MTRIVRLFRDPEQVVDQAVLRRMRRQRHVRTMLEQRRQRRSRAQLEPTPPQRTLRERWRDNCDELRARLVDHLVELFAAVVVLVSIYDPVASEPFILETADWGTRLFVMGFGIALFWAARRRWVKP